MFACRVPGKHPPLSWAFSHAPSQLLEMSGTVHRLTVCQVFAGILDERHLSVHEKCSRHAVMGLDCSRCSWSGCGR